MSELESAAREVYKYAKIAVNQIICMGGESCQPCENREQLAIALDELERVLSGLTPLAPEAPIVVLDPVQEQNDYTPIPRPRRKSAIR